VIPHAILDNADIDDATKTEVRLHFVSLVFGIMGAASNNEACVLVALLCHACNANACTNAILFVLFRKLGHAYYFFWAGVVLNAFLGVVLNAFFAYPHVMLLKELRNRRMTPHKDVHENQSCHWVNDDAV